MQKVSKYKTAAVYARAWLDAAKDKKIEEKAIEEAKLLKDACHDAPETWKLLAAPAENESARREIIAAVAKQFKLSAVSTETLLLAAENGRLKYIRLMAEEFIRLYYEDKGIVQVLVETAVPSSESQDRKLKNALEKKLNAPVLTEYAVKPEVLGGLRVRFNSYLIDDTLESKLAKMAQMIKEG